jgi:hypothetical protein
VSALWNALFPGRFTLKHEIGHVSVALSCESAHRSELTGMTTSDLGDHEEHDLLLKKKAGLGVLFHIYGGRLQRGAEVRRDLAERVPRGRVSWLRFGLSKAACARLVRYLDEYRDRGYEARYGLPLRPLYGEGAGCSAFGASFLEQAGLLEGPLGAELKAAWSGQVRVPESLIGADESPSGRRVSWLALLAGARGWRWARPAEPGREIFFWDPDLLNSWIRRTWARERAHPTGRFVLEQAGRARGLAFDARNNAVPTGPLWRHDSEGP